MKYLLVGLGNMGIEYENTRHNIGFDVADALAREGSASFDHESLGDLALIKHRGRRIYVLKPSTYMNRSGKAVRHWLQKLKIPRSNLLVIVDELQLPYGKTKLTKKGKDGGHNGLRDIQNMLQGTDYARLRIGIGRDFKPGQQVNYVLGKWNAAQRQDLDGVIAKAVEIALSFVAIGPDHTMTKFNRN
ncbi:MAG: aminoacyl-tRNA hydrolase [Saprospiraceae bacterium]|nr:aminoacyl-tRNA hydrolase [Saprospiraceae bacterium]